MPARKQPHNKSQPRSKLAGLKIARTHDTLDTTIMILGAPGLVGAQVTRQVARELCPATMVLATLAQNDFGSFVTDLKKELQVLADQTKWEKYRQIELVEIIGNIFVRPELALAKREELQANSEHRKKLHNDLFSPLSEAQENSMLVEIIRKYRPNVVIDCINTATGISYQQDVDKACVEIRNHLDDIKGAAKGADLPLDRFLNIEKEIEILLISQSIQQIVRHIQLLHTAMKEAETRLYIKVGTTGTGGMGLNIPYTHGEDKPSAQLMAKASIGFAHTGLMFLMARTPDAPIVKEIKPAAMVGYKKVVYQELKKHRKYSPKRHKLTRSLKLDLPKEAFKDRGRIKMVGVDTGENGFFARGEFEAITSINQMEFVTPEEIASTVVMEIKGGNTGHDMIAAIDGAVMLPSYRAGYLRGSAIESLLRLQEEHKNPHSVATGDLGPSKLTKLLYEAHLLYQMAKDQYPAGNPPLQAILDYDAEEISKSLEAYLNFNKELRDTIISIGIPILLRDGKTLLRGPHIKVPEEAHGSHPPVSKRNIALWADQGWVDLRRKNIIKWQERFSRMLKSAETIHLHGSAEITMEAYRSKEIMIGEVVGWIFNNEEDGYRIKW